MKIKVTRYCEMTGEDNTMIIDSTPDLLDRIAAWMLLPDDHKIPVSDFFGDLTSGEQDFIETGLTPEIENDIFNNLLEDA